MRYEYSEDEDEDEAYDRLRQHDIDELKEQLEMAETRRAPRTSRIAAGLLRFFDVKYEDLKGRRKKR
ncbi:hypothetical protein LCGC14_0373610 [marine sediment metagenome]|uniref:Uncharacterized protein n=1 Tax=marine sediment metagenome TaxID=412755 RepID=A0A0F9VRQ4_9ZZZZ